MLAVLALAADRGGAPLPADDRLAAEREPLRALVERTADQGLPADMLISKVREGLAKNVEARQIRTTAERLVVALERAQAAIVERRSGAPARELLSAVALAQLAGCALGDMDSVLRSPVTDVQAARAIDVLVDLVLRGYPAEPAGRVVGVLLAREPDGIGRLPAILESARREQALSQRDVIDMLAATRSSLSALPAELMRAGARDRTGGAPGGRLIPANDVRAARGGVGQVRGRRR